MEWFEKVKRHTDSYMRLEMLIKRGNRITYRLIHMRPDNILRIWNTKIKWEYVYLLLNYF